MADSSFEQRMCSLGLQANELRLHDQLMATGIIYWPESLKEYVNTRHRGIAMAVADWIRKLPEAGGPLVNCTTYPPITDCCPGFYHSFKPGWRQCRCGLSSICTEEESAANTREFCICAAVRLDDGRVIRGHRHNDCLRTAVDWEKAGQNIGHIRSDQQGFVTSHGRFVNREEAMCLQRAISNVAPVGHKLAGDILFSDDLY